MPFRRFDGAVRQHLHIAALHRMFVHAQQTNFTILQNNQKFNLRQFAHSNAKRANSILFILSVRQTDPRTHSAAANASNAFYKCCVRKLNALHIN